MGLGDRGQTVGPPGHPAGSLDTDSRAEQRRRLLRSGPQPSPVDGDQAVMADLLAGEESAHDLDALPQPGVADRLPGPSPAGDVLVGRLAGAQRNPEAAGVHRLEGARGLGDDGRVVSLARRVHHSEWQAGRLQSGTEPRPSETGVALGLAPGREVVGAHRPGEADVLRQLHRLQQCGGMDLLVGGVHAEDRHSVVVPWKGRHHTARRDASHGCFGWLLQGMPNWFGPAP